MYANLLLHTATVHRRSGRIDRFQQPVDQNPSQRGPVTSTFPCRATKGRGGRVNEERSRDVYEVTYTVHALPDADIREDDTVVVTDASGTEIMPAAKVKVKETKFDGTGPHHLEITCVVQRGPL